MDEALVRDFLRQYDDSRFPADFLARYEAMECLSQNELGETLLVQDRMTGETCVAKCFSAHASRQPDFSALRALAHPGLPQFLASFDNGSMRITVRTYVEGFVLGEWAALRQPSVEQAVDIGIQLCRILDYLHTRTPPIIHRDLKPQNIIIDAGGHVTLIDFGIARLYDARQGQESTFFGTKPFAPPEQYGFSATDSRSDIFSLGVVLTWLMTGETDTHAALARIPDRRLANVLRRATAFAPKDRYKDAPSVERALAALGLGTHGKGRAFLLAVCGLLIATLSVSGVLFWINRVFPANPIARFWTETTEQAAVPRFTQPLIEQAARLALGKAEDAPLTYTDLKQVTALYVFEDTVFKTDQEFYAHSRGWYDNTDRKGLGPIDSLEDLRLMPNLKYLYLANECFSDISVLAELPLLEQVEFREGVLRDISALASCAGLESVGLNSNPMLDITVLSQLKHMNSLDLCNADFYDASAISLLGDFDFLDIANKTDSYKYLAGKRIRVLKLGYSLIDSLDWLDEVTGLEELDIPGTKIRDLTKLAAHPTLKTVWLSENMRDLTKTLPADISFTIIYCP